MVISIVFVDDNGTPTYDVESASNGADRNEGRRDDGANDAWQDEAAERTHGGRKGGDRGGSAVAHVVAAATMVAEQKAHGKAIQSELTTKSGQPAFEIDVVTGDQVSEVVVDPVTGAIIIK